MKPDKRIHYGWIVCFAGTLLLFCTVGCANSVFPVYLPIMRQVTGISFAQCSVITMVRNLTSVFFMFFVDRYIRLVDIRLGVTIGLVIVSISFIINSFSDGFALYCVGAFTAGMGYGLGGLVPVSILMNRWFHSHRTFAVSICVSGSGIATIVMSPLVTILSERFSLRFAFRAEAVFLLTCSVLIYSVIRNRPSDMGLEPVSDGGAAAEKARALNTTNAGKLSMFCIYTSMVMLGMGIYATNSNYSLLFTTEGIDVVRASFLVSVFGFTLAVGKLIYGAAVDRFTVLPVSVVCHIITFIAIMLCTLCGLPNGYIIAMTGMIIMGPGNALATVAQPAYAGALSSTKDYPRYSRKVQVAYTIGGVTVGPFPGILADRMGSYVPVFRLFSLLQIGSMLFAIASIRIRQKELKASEVQTNDET